MFLLVFGKSINFRYQSILSKIILYEKVQDKKNSNGFSDIDFANNTKKAKLINTNNPFVIEVKKKTYSNINISLAVLENFYFEYANGENIFLEILITSQSKQLKKLIFQFPSDVEKIKKNGFCFYIKGNNWLNFELDIIEFYNEDVQIEIIPKIDKDNFILFEKNKNKLNNNKNLYNIKNKSIAISEPYYFNKSNNHNNFIYFSFESLADIFLLSRKYNFDLKRLKNLNKIIEDSEVCTRCYSFADSTLPHIASSQTALCSSQHEFGDYSKNFQNQILNDKIVTLAEILKRKGYYTSGVTTYPRFDRLFGWNKGYYNWFNNDKPFLNDAPTANDICNEIYRLKNKKFFIFTHFDQLHAPLLNNNTQHGFNIDLKSSTKFLRREDYLSLYFDKLMYLDDQLGRIVSYLKNIGLYDNTTIFITGDHGPAFPPEWDMKNLDYANYEFHARVPLIIKHSQKSIVKKNEIPCNSQSKIFSTVLSKINEEFPEYFYDYNLFQVNDKFRNLSVTETIKHPKKDRYAICLIDNKYKFWSYYKNFWDTNSDNILIEKRIYKIDELGDANENENLINDISKDELKVYEQLSESIMESNMKFRNDYSIKNFSLKNFVEKI